MAHIVNGHIQSSWDWDWRAADASYRRALEIAPNSAAALRAAGYLAVALDRFDQGNSRIDLAPIYLNCSGYRPLNHKVIRFTP